MSDICKVHNGSIKDCFAIFHKSKKCTSIVCQIKKINIKRYTLCIDGKDWMAPTASVSGFAWKRSKQSVTEGILMWPEPFMVKDKKGEEV